MPVPMRALVTSTPQSNTRDDIYVLYIYIYILSHIVYIYIYIYICICMYIYIYIHTHTATARSQVLLRSPRGDLLHEEEHGRAAAGRVQPARGEAQHQVAAEVQLRWREPLWPCPEPCENLAGSWSVPHPPPDLTPPARVAQMTPLKLSHGETDVKARNSNASAVGRAGQ